MPSEEQAAGLGIPLSAYRAQAPVPVWPENRTAVLVFQLMSTQWRAGMGGYTGLDYGALREIWQRLHIKRRERDQVFFDLRVLEHAALEAIHDSKD